MQIKNSSLNKLKAHNAMISQDKQRGAKQCSFIHRMGVVWELNFISYVAFPHNIHSRNKISSLLEIDVFPLLNYYNNNSVVELVFSKIFTKTYTYRNIISCIMAFIKDIESH